MEIHSIEKVLQFSYGMKLLLPFTDLRDNVVSPINIDGTDTWEVRIVKPDGSQLIKTTGLDFPDDTVAEIAVTIDALDLDRKGKYYYQVVKTTGPAEMLHEPLSFTVTGSLPTGLPTSSPGYVIPVNLAMSFTAPAEISLTANQNNWNPGGRAGMYDLAPNAVGREITGLVFDTAFVNGEVHIFRNTGSGANTVIFKNNSGSSTAANRFLNAGGADITLAVGESVMAIYDTDSDLHFLYKLGGSAGGMSIGGTVTSATAGSILYAGTSSVLAQENTGLFYDEANNQTVLTASNDAVPPLCVQGQAGGYYVDVLKMRSQIYGSLIWQVGGGEGGSGVGLGLKLGANLNDFFYVADAANTPLVKMYGGGLYGAAVMRMLILPYDVTTIGQVIKLAASATADAFQIRNSSNTVLTKFDKLGAWQPASMANASAPNDSVYYSTDASKLVYKDAGGTVNNLY